MYNTFNDNFTSFIGDFLVCWQFSRLLLLLVSYRVPVVGRMITKSTFTVVRLDIGV